MEKKTIGAFIAALRKANGLTQKQLAEKLNVSDKAVSRWERDECAPDLSLIPVLAEIFGVTSDEILRGQRKQPEEPDTKYEARQTGKQLANLMNHCSTRYRIQSIISAGFSVLGLIAAMICNTGFLRANIGFFAGSVFYLIAAVCQVIFTVLALSSVSGSEISPEDQSRFRKEVIQTAEGVFLFTAVLFAGTLPLLVLIDDAYIGLSGSSWLVYGLIYGLVGFAVGRLVLYMIHARLGYQSLPDMTKPRNKLRLRSILLLVLVLLVTFVGHVSIHNFLWENTHVYYPGTRWDSWEELKEYLETPVSEDGEALTLVSCTSHADYEECEYVDEDGYPYSMDNTHQVLVYETDMETPKYEYILRNHEVRMFSYGLENGTFPIYTYTHAQYRRAESRLESINIILCILYPLEVIVAVLIYNRKAKKTPS